MDKRMQLPKSLYLLGLATLSLIAAAFAWFHFGYETKADQMDMVAVEALELGVSIEGSTNPINLEEVSGNGFRLYKPEKDPYTGLPLENADGSWKLLECVKDVDYMEFDVVFQGNMPGTVIAVFSELQSGGACAIIPADLEDEQRLNDMVTAGEGSLPIHRDYIAGAVRVSFSEVVTTLDPQTGEETETETLSAIWIPNARYQLTNTPDPAYPSRMLWHMQTEGENETAYTFYNGRSLTEPVMGDPAPENMEPFFWIAPEEDGSYTLHWEDNPTVARLRNDPQGGTSARVRVRIWAEGTDREAQSPLAGGIFRTRLVFASMGFGKDGTETTITEGETPNE